MNRQQAAEFIHALNMLQPHVAPLLFDHLAKTDVVRLVASVANSQAICDVRAVDAESTKNAWSPFR